VVVGAAAEAQKEADEQNPYSSIFSYVHTYTQAVASRFVVAGAAAEAQLEADGHNP
jgi:hypothetical protein